MELKNFFAQDDQGNKLPGATCYVYRRGTASLAEGLKRANGLPLDNPFITDENGLVQFAAANGLYDVRVVAGARDNRLSLQFNDVAETVVAAETAAGRAESALNTSLLNAGIYSSTALGILATRNGEFFSVPSTENTEHLILYKNESGVPQVIKRYPSSMQIDALESYIASIAGESFASVPQFFESLDDQLPQSMILSPTRRILAQFPDPGVQRLQQSAVKSDIYESLDRAGDNEVWIRDAHGKIIARLASASIATVVAALSASTSQLQGLAVKSNFYESLDPKAQVLFLDATGKVLSYVPSVVPLEAELAKAAGIQPSLSDRLAKGLTPYGDVLGPYANRWSVRDARMRLERREAGDTIQWVLALLGDSYSNDRSFYSQAFAKRLQDRYGMAGVGWVGFGWYSAPTSGAWTSALQPVGISGSVRSDLAPICQLIGNWTCSYNAPGTNMPALYKSASSTPEDYVRFSVPAAGASYANSCRLFHSGDGTGVIAVSWDDGVSYGETIALTAVGADNILLPGTPAAGCVARIKVVSGNVGLGGVDLQNTAPGVRVHKLGSSGARSVQWAAVGAPWRVQMLALGSHCHQVMLGTNDQTDSGTPAAVASNFSTIFANLFAVLPYSDKVLVMPAENQRTTNTVSMPQYARAGREFAVSHDIGFVDLQYFFGSPANFAFDYAASNPARPWYAADLIHPAGQTGGKVISNALFNFYTQS